MSKPFDPQHSFEQLKEGVVKTIQEEYFPGGEFKGKKQTLRLKGLEVKDNRDFYDLAAQQETKETDGTWAVPLKADLELVDNATGKVLDKKITTIANLPKLTPRFSYIVDGKERQVDHQSLLKRGIYTRVADNGVVETRFNTKTPDQRQTMFKVNFDPESHQYSLGFGATKAPLYPVLKAMGTSDDDLRSAWGKEILEHNKTDDKKALGRVYKALHHKEAENDQELLQGIRDKFHSLSLDPEVTEMVVGARHENTSGAAFLDATKSILDITRGDKKPSGYDDLRFKQAMHTEDYVPERLREAKKSIVGKLSNNIDRADKIDRVLQRSTFERPITNFFTGSSLSMLADQTNPLGMITGHTKHTILGEHGISSPHQVTTDAKIIHPSSYGFLDPSHTPECYTPDTEVFTDRGWVRWDEVRPSHMFACRINGRLEFHHAEQLVCQPYQGYMYEVTSPRIEYAVTPNHRLYVRPKYGAIWRICLAEEANNKKWRFTSTHEPLIGVESEFEIPESSVITNKTKLAPPIPMDDWCVFLGWYLSEGSCCYDPESSQYHVKIHQKNEQYLEEIREMLDRLPFSWCENKEGSFSISTRQVAEYLSQMGKCYDKYLPAYVLSAPIPAREGLLDALMKGDGRTVSNRSSGVSYFQQVYTTTSAQLARDVERLAISLGHAVTVNKYQDNREERYLDVYEVRLLKHREWVVDPQRERSAARYSVTPYDGTVYCATVPGGLLLVRKGDNKKVGFWSGNSDRTGISLQIPLGTWKEGNELVTRAVNAKTGKLEKVTAKQLAGSNLAFPDEFKMKPGKKPVPVSREVTVADNTGETRQLDANKVDYILPSPAGVFSATTNLIPFLQNNNGNRIGYGTQQAHQALALVNREEPLVQSATGTETIGGDDTFEGVVGVLAGHRARAGGTVTKVTDTAVHVKGSGGEVVKHSLYKDYPLNNKKGVVNSAPLVKLGDTVKKGQPLADNSFTKNGKLAIGTNLDVAYVPAGGYNFEDGIVISESAAKKLTSEHLYKKQIQTHQNLHVGGKKHKAHYPTAYTKNQLANVDADGVVKPGSKVKPGDPLILAVTKNTVTSEAEGLARVSKGLVKDWKDSSISWEGDAEGTVSKVVRHGNKIKVHVKTEESMQVGDKLVGRHGNKGICFSLENHEVMTENGWKSFDDVTTDERIATLNHVTGEIEYQCPTNLIYYEYNGSMVRIKSRHVEMLCTPEHRLFVQWGRQDRSFELKAAQELVGKRVRMKKGAVWSAPDVLNLRLADKIIERHNSVESVPGDSWARFLGYYVTEGFRTDTCGHRYVYICQDITKNPEKVEEIASCLDELGYSYSYLEERRFRIASTQLYELMEECGDGAVNKKLPSYILQWSARQLGLLWDALVSGDGHRDLRTGAEAFYSCSQKLIGQAQEILLKLGYSGNVLTHIEEGTFIFGQHELKNTCYRINKNVSTNYVTVDPKKKGDVFEVEPGFSGEVGCVEVPNHLIYVRSNGKAVWVGNCTQILPESEMPQLNDQITGEKKAVQVLLNPMGVPGRINPGQLLETSAGLIAKKTGKTYKVRNFDPNVSDFTEKMEQDLAKHGLKATSELYDPKTGKSMGEVHAGAQFMMKLDQQVSKKMSARGAGYGEPYDVNMAPTTGGGRLGALGNYAMLAHGAKHNLREMQTIKSSFNDEAWRSIQTGDAMPAPRPPYAYEKLTGLLKGMGINTHKEGNQIVMEPLTDKQVDELSNGEVRDPGRMLYGKDLKAEKEGLFDPKVFGKDEGGLRGTKWGHIELAEPMPNPVFEKAILTLTGLTGTKFQSILAGKENLDGKTGPVAIKSALEGIEVSDRLSQLEKDIKGAPASKLDKMNKEIRYLRNLKRMDISPTEAYMRKKVPILPPIMRPLSVMDDGSLNTDDLNALYRGVGLVNKKINEMDPDLRELPEESGKLYGSLYDGMKALTGIGTLPTFHQAKRDKLRSIMGKIEGKDPEGKGSPKTGFFQETVMSRKQDMSMRSTIIPNQRINLDEVAIPRAGALQMYKPHLVRELRNTGMTTLQAQEAIKLNDRAVDTALEKVMTDTPLLLKRDPVLHKFGVMAFKPRLAQGQAIEIHPLVTGGFNADFDGDLCKSLVLLIKTPESNANSIDKEWGISYTGEVQSGTLTRIGDAVTSRYHELIVGLNESDEVFMCDLEDFPHIPRTKRRAHDDAHFYAVPDGIRVLAWDESVGKFRVTPVKWWSTHYDKAIEVVTLRSGRELVTDDDERAVYGIDPTTLEYCRRRPSESLGVFVPSLKDMDVPVSVESISLDEDVSKRLRSNMRLDQSSGYLLGLVVGDGWVVYVRDVAKGVSFAVTDEGVEEGFRSALISAFHDIPTISAHDLDPADKGALPGSKNRRCITVSCAALGRSFSPLCGRGADKKHLPPFFLAAPRAFRLGLLAGLLDTDGSISQSHAKSKPQWMVSFATTSTRLAYEFRLLCRSLGVTANMTESRTPKGGLCWALTVSTVELHKIREMPCWHTEKKDRFSRFFSEPSPDKKGSYSRFNVVPMSGALAEAVRAFLGTKGLTHSEYVTLSKVKDRFYLSRELAAGIWSKLQDAGFTHEHFDRWAALLNPKVSWDPVVSFEPTRIIENGYDLTVPGYETFMSVDGVILSNTMAAFAPVGKEAVEEARRMLPSNNLFNPTDGSTMYAPGHEAQTGMYRLSQLGKKTKHRFTNEAAAAGAMEKGDIKFDDQVRIGGKTTTMGRVMLDRSLPEEMRGKITGSSKPLNKSFVGDLLDEAARSHAKDYPDMIQQLKDLGNDAATKTGLTISLKDIRSNKALKERVFGPYKAQEGKIRDAKGLSVTEKEKRISDMYRGGIERYDALLKEDMRARNSSLMVMADSGGVGGSKWNALKQIAGAPVMFEDAKGKPVPVPVLRSYSEGLKLADFMTAAHGARMGTLSKSQGTSEPGALSKNIVNSTMNQLVAGEDCGTDKGILMEADNPDAIDRFVATDTRLGRGKNIPAGTQITPEIRDRMRGNGVTKIHVRSSLKCAHGDGICQKCAGISDDGTLWDEGTNLGIIAAQAMGEPTTQMSMSAFHSGGVIAPGAGTLRGSKFQTLKDLLNMTETIKDSAKLAPIQGRITNIRKDPAGGNRLTLSGAGQSKSFWSPDLLPGIKVGRQVKAGDAVSSGPVNPRELLPLAGLDAVKGSLTNQIHDTYDGRIRRRHVETVVRAMTDLAKVKDAGDSPDLLPGDITSAARINSANTALGRGKDPAKFQPILKGLEQMPTSMQEDWAARMNYRHLKRTVVEGALQGWKADIHGRHPVPGMMYGAEFGRSKDPNRPY